MAEAAEAAKKQPESARAGWFSDRCGDPCGCQKQGRAPDWGRGLAVIRMFRAGQPGCPGAAAEVLSPGGP